MHWLLSWIASLRNIARVQIPTQFFVFEKSDFCLPLSLCGSTWGDKWNTTDFTLFVPKFESEINIVGEDMSTYHYATFL